MAYEKKWVEEAIFDHKVIRLAVCLKENNQYIVNVYILDINERDRKGNSHILIGEREHWGKGYAAEAYELLLNYAFNERSFHRIGATFLKRMQHLLHCIRNVDSLKMAYLGKQRLRMANGRSKLFFPF